MRRTSSSDSPGTLLHRGGLSRKILGNTGYFLDSSGRTGSGLLEKGLDALTNDSSVDEGTVPEDSHGF